MADPVEKDIFKQGSKTYYWSTAFFPKKYRSDVFALYSFVRTADDYVDAQPAQPQKLLGLEKAYLKAVEDPDFELIPHSWDDIDTRAIKNIVRLTHKHKFDRAWVESFFAAMKQDIDHSGYKSLDDSLKYVYGSAEVIGLMMAKIMGVPEEGYQAAQVQGRAMQWINFIRDIEEDNQLGRVYFPREDLRKYNLKDLSKETAEAEAAHFKRFMQTQLDRYKKWQAEADRGMEYIPARLRPALKTAVDMYNWTAQKIEKDPFIVFDKKVKPGKIRVISSGTRIIAGRIGKLLTQHDKIIVKK